MKRRWCFTAVPKTYQLFADSEADYSYSLTLVSDSHRDRAQLLAVAVTVIAADMFFFVVDVVM